MYLIEKLSDKIASKIALVLNMDEDHEEVLAYGAFTIIETIFSIILVLVFGMIFDVLLESCIISFTGAILRKYSGGAHATSPNRCAIIGVIMSVGPALIIEKINQYDHNIMMAIILSFGLSYYIIYKHAPVDTHTKRIEKKEKRKRFKKQSMILLTIYLMITIIVAITYFKTQNVILLNSIVAIQLGVFWQSITLISLGHFIIHKLDRGLCIGSRLKGGEKNEE